MSLEVIDFDTKSTLNLSKHIVKNKPWKKMSHRVQELYTIVLQHNPIINHAI